MEEMLFTLEEVYQYAEKLGYSREDVEIEEIMGYDYDEEKEFFEYYVVSFGHEYTEVWAWYFDSLEETATDYDHDVCEED